MFTQRQARLEDAVFVKRGLSVANVVVVAVLAAVVVAWILLAVVVLDWGEHRIRLIIVSLVLIGATGPLALVIRARLGATHRLGVQGNELLVDGEALGLESVEFGHVSDGGPWEARVTVQTRGGTKLALRCPQTRVADLDERMAPIQARPDVLALAFGDRMTGKKHDSSLPPR